MTTVTEKRLLYVSLICSFIFASAELVLAYFSSSITILIDGVYDLTVSFFILLTCFFIKRTRVKRLVDVLRSISLLLFLVGMAVSNILLMIFGKSDGVHPLTYIFEGGLVFVSFITYLYIIIVDKKEKSKIGRLEKMTWKSNLLGTFCVFFVFLINRIFGQYFSSFVNTNLDSMISIILSFVLAVDPIKALKDIDKA